MHCCHCFTELPEPTANEAFIAKGVACLHCKTVNPIGIEVREAMLADLFQRVQLLSDSIDVLCAISPQPVPVPNKPMPAAPGITPMYHKRRKGA